MGIKIHHSKTHSWACLKACCVVLAVALICGCASSAKAPGKKITGGMARILVLPFTNMTRMHGEMESVKSPLGEKFYLTGKVEGDGEVFLTDHLIGLLDKRAVFEVISVDQLSQTAAEALAYPDQSKEELQRILDLGHKAGVDGVFAGYVFRYRERVGSTMAVSSAASVIFELHFIDVKRPDLAWSGYYAETQKSLSENLLDVGKFLKRGSKWITAEEMAGVGLAELLDQIQ